MKLERQPWLGPEHVSNVSGPHSHRWWLWLLLCVCSLLHRVVAMDDVICQTHGQHRCRELAGDDEDDAVIRLAHHLRGGVDREGIELLHPTLGSTSVVVITEETTLALETVACTGVSCSAAWLMRSTVGSRWTAVVASWTSSTMLMVFDLGRALRQTGDEHHRDAHRG
ncbi:hypothetical protein VPH35_082458 [Triticum aestivum]